MTNGPVLTDSKPSSAPGAAGPIPVRNVWYMLLYAWELARFRGRLETEPEEAPDLVMLLARVLVDLTRGLLRRGLHRDYIERSESMRHLRGRVDVTETVRRLELIHGRVTCRFDELEVDTLANRILRTTLRRLSDSQRLREEGRGLHDAVVDLSRRLEGIGVLPSVRHEQFALVRIDRNNAVYRLVMEVCRLLSAVAMPTQLAGRDRFLGLLDDEVLMRRVFEAFVRNFYRMHCLGYDVRSEILKWPEESAAYGLLPVMKTDISLSSPTRRIVIDTKYYSETLTTRYDRKTFHSENLYQIYAYLRTQEDRGGVYATAEGILLYPAVDTQLDASHEMQGHKIRVATLDLDQPWPEIERCLLSLIAAN